VLTQPVWGQAEGGEHPSRIARWFGQSSFATHALATERNAVIVDRSLPLDKIDAAERASLGGEVVKPVLLPAT